MNIEILENILKESVEITRKAGDVIMGFYKSGYSSREKSPDNPVTDADLAADSMLKDNLMKLLPEAGWLSEETVDSPERLKKKCVWIIDPLDGTKEFIKGIPEFSVSVALVENGDPLMGIIYNPPKKDIFYCHRDGDVYFNGKIVKVTKSDRLKDATVLASRTEYNRGEFKPFEKTFKISIMGSTAYKLAMVAAGMCDASWSRGPKNEWDICAGVLLIKEAGGRCVDLNDRPFSFNRRKTLVNGFISDNGIIHEKIARMIIREGAARSIS